MITKKKPPIKAVFFGHFVLYFWTIRFADYTKNLNINITENINTSAGMNISERTGINKTESAGANHSITAGGMMLQNAVMDYTLMAANIMEVAQGERKSRAKKINENSSEHSTSSQGKTNVLAKENIHKNSGEKSNFQ